MNVSGLPCILILAEITEETSKFSIKRLKRLNCFVQIKKVSKLILYPDFESIPFLFSLCKQRFSCLVQGHLSLQHFCFCVASVAGDASARVPLPLIMDAHSALAVLSLTAGPRPLAGHQAVSVRLIETFVQRNPLFHF